MNFFLEKEPTGFKRSLTEHLFSIHTLGGAILYSKKIPKNRKTLWIIQSIGSPLIVVSSSIAYLITKSGNDFFTFLYASQPIIATLSIGFLKVSFLRCHENISKLIAIVDEQFAEHQRKPDEPESKITQLQSWIRILSSKKIPTFASLVLILVVLVNICITLWYDTNKMGNITGYLYPFPNLDCIDSVIVYLVIMVLQSIIFMPPIFIGLLVPVFIFTLTLEFRKEFELLREDIKSCSEKFDQRMSSIYEQESKLKKNPIREMTSKRRRCCDEYFSMVNNFIRRHRLLVQSVRLFKQFLEDYFSLNLAFVIPMMVTSGFFFSTPMGKSRFSLLEIGMLFLCQFTAILFSCYTGQLFKDMNESIQMEVYSFPWYELTPKQRQVIHLFLCQTQRPITFTACKLYPITLELVPTIMNFVYSQIVGLKTIHDKK